ncbi:36302_t:CDS:2, partial [Racocetra persica]
QSSPTTPVDITDGKTMSDFEIQDQITDFLIGGSDTSAYTIIMAIILLLNHPEKLKNLRIELKSASLKYLNAIIDETFRLFPVTLTVTASIWKLHRSKQIWGQDVDEFIPERWFNLDPKIRNDAYYPFGSGSRFCIGNNFALMEIRIILSALLINFDFVVKEDADLQIVQFITPSLRSKKFEVKATRLREGQNLNNA